jgi:hypothetical protein
MYFYRVSQPKSYMKENESALFSRYIIDGIHCDATPYELLGECMADIDTGHDPENEYADIIDESTDPPLTSFTYRNEDNQTYIEEVAGYRQDRPFRILYPETFTKTRIAAALLERLWNKGHYKLGDLAVWIEWDWNSKPLGNMATFYKSAKSASEYIYDLGCHLEGYSYDGSDEESWMRVAAWLPEAEDLEGLDENEEIANDVARPLFKSSPYESSHPWISEDRQCPEMVENIRDSQLLYIPFETSPFRLGGSLLAEIKGHNGGTPPQISDPDYFIDCYEVVRELVEDGFITAGVTIADGGLAKAVQDICGQMGIQMNLKGIMTSYMDDDTTRILFSEIPGVIVQVDTCDMDYIDSQLLLQDVAYYPIGSPDNKLTGIRLEEGRTVTVAGILESLINQATEGED